MSLASVGKVKQTAEVVLKHPDPAKTLKNPDGSLMTVTLHGPYSERRKTILRAQQQRRMTELEASGDTAFDADALETYTREMVIGCIESWNIWDTPEQKREFSPESAADLFDEHPWAFDQISLAVGRTANFLDAPKSN
jgi:hypothetical protein